MIDSHCHLEQKDYDSDRDAVIEKCKAEGIKAVISSCAHPNDFNKGKEIVERYKNFVFLAAGIHPHYAKELTDKEIESAFNWLRDNANILSGIGEQGLDYSWAKEPKWREKQQKLFIKLIELAKELNKVIIVHARDSHSDVIRILEQQEAEVVQLHM